MTDAPSPARRWSQDQGTQHWTRPIDGGYRLRAHRPAPAPADAALPVLWVLDAATLFPMVASALDWLSRRPDASGVGPMLVAGIDREPRDTESRFRDFTFGPPADPAGQVGDVPWGGGVAFAELIAGPASSALAETFPVDNTRQALFGHSLAGLFALHMLACCPGRYRAIGAVSPSLWWDFPAISQRLADLADTGEAVFLAAGGLEEPAEAASEAEERRRARRVVSNVEAAGAILARSLGPDRVHVEIGAGESHASAPLALLPAFLRFASAALAR